MRKLAVSNPSLVNNLYGNANSPGEGGLLLKNEQNELDFELFNDEQIDKENSARKSKIRRSLTYNKSQSKSKLEGFLDSLEIDSGGHNGQFNEEDQENFQHLKDIRDDISLDSMQLISKADENMQIPNFDQDEDETNFVKKEILLKKFEQEMQMNQDFEKLLQKSEDYYNKISKNQQYQNQMNILQQLKDKKGNIQQFNALGLFKDVITSLFKEDLPFLTQLCLKFSKMKDQILDQVALGLKQNTKERQKFQKIEVQVKNVNNQVEVVNGETQTDFVDFYDTIEVGVYIPELYKFDQRAYKLVKMSIESQDDRILIKQQEYLAKNAFAWQPFLEKGKQMLNSERASHQRSLFRLNDIQERRSGLHSREKSQDQHRNKASSPEPKKIDIFTSSVLLNSSPQKRLIKHLSSNRDKTANRRKSSHFDYQNESTKIANRVLTERNKKLDDHLRHEDALKNFNITMQKLLKQIQEYEADISQMQTKKYQLSHELKFKASQLTQDDQVYKDIFNNAYQIGFQRGLAHGFFKGAIENQNIFAQKGMHEGMKEGWLSGFDDGAEYGIKKVFREAYVKGIDLSILDIREYLDMAKLRREKLNEYEKIFNQIEYSDKQERVLKLLEDYKNLSKKQKLKYATIGRKNLLKLIHQVYSEKFQLGKNSKLILLEILYDYTKIKYGSDGVIDKKLYRVFSSCIFHAPTCKRIAIFAKFLQLGKRNLSNEILHVYLNGIFLLKNKNFNNQLTRNLNDEESVGIARALESFKELLEKDIPLEIFPLLRRKVESLQIREDGQVGVNTVDVDKYLEYCTTVYQRFHLNYQNRLQVVFNSWTLYQDNFIYGEQLYLILRVMMGNDRDKIIFHKKEEEIKEARNCEEIMSSLRERIGSFKGEIQIRYDQFQEVFTNSDLCTGDYVQKEFFDQIIFFEDQQEVKRRFEKQVREAHYELRSLFYGVRQYGKKIFYLEPEQVWYERLVRIDNSVNFIHPALLQMSILIMRKSFQYFARKVQSTSPFTFDLGMFPSKE